MAVELLSYSDSSVADLASQFGNLEKRGTERNKHVYSANQQT